MWKWVLRVGGGAIALVLVTMIGCLIAYASWLPGYKRELEAGSRVASTPLGPIEYAIAGEGIPLLRIHGSPGGYDHTIAGPRARPEDTAGFKVIAPSRPGYLRTPLSSGRTAAEQADLYAALLDELKVERAIVYGVSGGGPSALQFALRHPDRTLGLILVVPYLVTDPGYDYEKPSAIAMLGQDFSFWLAVQLMNERLASWMMPRMMPGFDAHDETQMAQMREIGRGFVPSKLRSAGRSNDIVQYRALGIESWPLETMSVPTLIMHGNADENAPYEGSAKAAARIANAELVTFSGGDHYIIITRTHEIRDRIGRFALDLPKE